MTSPNGADEVARRARNLPKVAAVGPGTAETLRGHGIEPAFVASVSTAEHMAGEFPEHEGKVLYLAAENSRRGPIDALEADFVPLYSTMLLEPEVGQERDEVVHLPRTGVLRDGGDESVEIVGPGLSHDLDPVRPGDGSRPSEQWWHASVPAASRRSRPTTMESG